jgi:AP-1 complex subunit gamma-1
MTSELLNYLVLCPREHRSDICTRILKVVDRFSTSDRWRVDTLITTLTIAGRESSRDVQNATIVYISRADTDIHIFATHKLLKAIRDDDGSQTGLLAVGVWCIGEFGDLLLQPYTYQSTSNNNGMTKSDSGITDLTSNGNAATTSVSFMALDPLSVVTIVDQVTKRHSCPEYIKQRALTAYVKLSERYVNSGDTNALETLQKLLDKHKMSRSLELQLRSCEFTSIVYASKGLAPPKVVAPPSAADIDAAAAAPPVEEDLFGFNSSMTDDTATTMSSSSSSGVSAGVQHAAKEALARMPAVDIKILQKRLQADEMQDGGIDMMPRGASRSSSVATTGPGSAPASGGGDLLDFFGGGGSGGDTIASLPSLSQNGGAGGSTKSDPMAGKSDLDLLSDIFSAQATTTSAPTSAAPLSGGFDIFSQTSTAAAAAPISSTSVNPMDLFGAPAAMAQPMSTMSSDPFGNNTVMSSSMPTNQQPVADLFGAPSPAVSTFPMMTTQQQQPQQQQQQPSTSLGGIAANEGAGLRVPAISHGGLIVEFECTKPESWNTQKSVLIAHFKNTTDAPIHGMNLQVAVPKFVKMEMDPPTSTTIPEMGNNNMGGNQKQVTQKVTLINSMLGQKNLALKLKIGFTLKGQKLEQMATCSGFPPGQY